MSFIETYPLQHSTIMRLYAEKEEIMLNPEYQRRGGVWTLEKKQLLIDSILNNYDLPKIYVHVFDRDLVKATGLNYAVIDGRQRLETIWQFIEGGFCLSDEFTYQSDEGIDLSGLSYDDISKEFPRIKIKFDSFVLPVVGVETDDIELIEDMFSRLNEAVPLNAAEKRNALGGDLVAAIRKVASNEFFKEKVRFSDKRFQHREVAARFLLVEENITSGTGRLLDTKKVYLDALATDYHSGHKRQVSTLEKSVTRVVDEMNILFSRNDELLRSQGNMVVYYLIFRFAINAGKLSKITRKKLLDFRDALEENRSLAATDYSASSFELLEYDRLSQQGTNDASNIKERVRVLGAYLGLKVDLG